MTSPYVIAFVGQKGGTGKTTSTANIAAVLTEFGYSVLTIDLDPQGGLSRYFGISTSDASRSVRAALTGSCPLSALIVPTSSGISLVPSHPSLATVGVEVTSYAETRLSQALMELSASSSENSSFDYVLIDCPPSLDLLPINGMHAANGVVIPFTPAFLPAATLPSVLRTVQEVRTLGRRPDLRVLGILPCQVNPRTRLTRTVYMTLPGLAQGVYVFPSIRIATAVAEAPGNRQPITQYAPQHPAADDYRRATSALLQSINGRRVE